MLKPETLTSPYSTLWEYCHGWNPLTNLTIPVFWNCHVENPKIKKVMGSSSSGKLDCKSKLRRTVAIYGELLELSLNYNNKTYVSPEMAIRERRGSVTGWVAPILVSLAWALSCASLPTLPSFFLWLLVFFLAFVSCISMSDSEAAFVALLLSHSSWDLRLYLVFSVAFFLSFLLVCEEEANSVSVSVSLCSNWACFFLLPLDVVDCFSLFLDRGFWSVLGSSLCELLSDSLLKRVDFFEFMEDRQRDQSFWSRSSWERKSHSEGEGERENQKKNYVSLLIFTKFWSALSLLPFDCEPLREREREAVKEGRNEKMQGRRWSKSCMKKKKKSPKW